MSREHRYLKILTEPGQTASAAVTAPRSQKVAPPPKVYLSYELTPAGVADSYKLRVNVSNVGEGPAYGLVVAAPSIPSPGNVAEIWDVYSKKYGYTDGPDMLIGDLEPGETTYGEFTIFAPGIEDWTKLPGLAVRTGKTGNVVVAPLALQRYDQKAYMDILDEIIAELELMSDNIEGTVNKIGEGLITAIMDTDEYFTHVQVAESVTYGLDAIAGLANVVGTVAGWKDAYGKLEKGFEKAGIHVQGRRRKADEADSNRNRRSSAERPSWQKAGVYDLKPLIADAETLRTPLTRFLAAVNVRGVEESDPGLLRSGGQCGQCQ